MLGEHMMNCCPTVCILILVLTATNSQSTCPTSNDFAVMNIEVIKANDGVTLQNIRVSWTYNQTYRCSDNTYSLRVERQVRKENRQGNIIYITSYYYLTLRDHQLEMRNPGCNIQYSVTLVYRSVTPRIRSFYVDGRPGYVFYGSSLYSAPSKIPQIFVGSDILDPNSRLSIFWYPLPCHLQNGNDVTSYILRYSFANYEEVNRTISTLDDILNCNQEPVGPHRCYLTNSLLLEDVLYTFQVAAVNGFGVGPFSDPVNATLYSQVSITKQKSTSTSSASQERHSDKINLSNAMACISSSKDALVVPGSLVAVMAVLTGAVNVVALIFCIVLWRRVNSYFKLHHSKVHERSTHGDEIETDKCQAYEVVKLSPNEGSNT